MTAKRRKKSKPASKANYGANEHPRKCAKCGCTDTTTGTTKQLYYPQRTLRYRSCDDCGQRFTTIDVK